MQTTDHWLISPLALPNGSTDYRSAASDAATATKMEMKGALN